MATIDEMRQVATQIENETTVGGNTAERVGGLFNDIVDELEDQPLTVENYPSADLAFADNNNDILVQFEDGHVMTKNFDSHGVNDKLNGIEAGAQANDIDATDDDSADLSFSDEEDNILVKFVNGHIVTKEFNSADINVNIGYAKEIINRYNGKVLSILGDSISTFGTPNQANAQGLWTYPNNRCRYPQSNLFTDVSKQYWYNLLNATGMTLGINESWAGSRVSNTASTDEGDVGPNRHIASMTRIGHLGENGTPDMILVYAGTNDVGHNVTIGTFNTESPIDYTEEQIQALPVATFADAYRTMLIRLQYYYPSSEIVCCFPNYTTSYYDIAKLDRYNEVVREACDFFGVKYIDLRTAGITILNRATYLPDGIHPNAAGMQLLFTYIYKHIIFE